MALDPSLLATVGFGTAALGSGVHAAVTMALDTGFRTFDTAEANIWYNQREVGRALKNFFDDLVKSCGVPGISLCSQEGLAVGTKIPPWELTTSDNIRTQAKDSREALVGFCDEKDTVPYPLDVYYIHAPVCWKGWHPRCKHGDETKLTLRESWAAMERVVADGNARRIGLSNVRPDELEDVIEFVRARAGTDPRARLPDSVQSHADPLDTNAALRTACRKHGIEFVSYSTLGTQHSMRNGGENPVLTDGTIGRIAERHGRSAAEVVLSWATQKGMKVIPRSGTQEHIQELGRLLREDTKAGFLEDGEVVEIDRLAVG